MQASLFDSEFLISGLWDVGVVQERQAEMNNYLSILFYAISCITMNM